MKYYIIAGEASGDLHGSNLMRGLYARDPEAEIRFWGGDLMNGVYTECDPDPGEYEPGHTGALARGMRYGGLVHHYQEGAVMGFWEVIRKGGRLLKNVRECKEDILAHRPDAVIRTKDDLHLPDNYLFYLGTPTSPLTGGISVSADYKEFRLSINGVYSVGAKQFEYIRPPVSYSSFSLPYFSKFFTDWGDT